MICRPIGIRTNFPCWKIVWRASDTYKRETQSYLVFRYIAAENLLSIPKLKKCIGILNLFLKLHGIIALFICCGVFFSVFISFVKFFFFFQLYRYNHPLYTLNWERKETEEIV